MISSPAPDFDSLLDEGEAAPVDGWDFSWFAGRATETRPPWGYQRLVSRWLPGAESVLDLQTGGGEGLAGTLESSGAQPERLRAPNQNGCVPLNLGHPT